jgi:hypothetical protein
MKKRFIIIFAISLALGSICKAQDTLWARNYGSVSSSELGLCGTVTSDGGYAVCGVSYNFSGGDFWLVRTDVNGDTVWTKDYGADRWQEAHYIIQTGDGGFAICGGSSIAVGNDDMFIVKTDSSGDTLWTRLIGNVGANDEAEAIIQTSDGCYLAVGMGSFSGNTQLYMVKLNQDGDQIWSRNYGGSSSDYAYGVVETPDSGFAITGTYSFGYANSDLWLLRTDSQGDTLWTRRFDFHNNLDRGDAIVLTADGGFAIGGRTWVGSSPQLLILRTDPDGNMLWSREFGGPSVEFAESIDITADGGFVIGGGAGPYPFDYYIVRVGPEGDSLWAARYDGWAGDSDDCYEVRVDDDGYIMAFGYSDISPSGYNSDYWLLKINDSQTTIRTDGDNMPSSISLLQNYPNPFNGSTTISYHLQTPSRVVIDIFDLGGRKVGTLINAVQTSGNHQVNWNASQIPSGIYFYKIQAGDYSQTKRAVLLK